MPLLSEGALAASRRLTARLLGYIRSGEAATRTELAELTGLSRSNIADRVAELVSMGLVVEAGTARSTGGRAPAQLRLNAEAACVGAIELGVTGMDIAVTDLNGRPLCAEARDWDLNEGPERTLTLAEEILRRLLREEAVARSPLAGIGVGFPGPVRFDVGRPVSPTGMPSWEDYPIRERLSGSFGVDVRVDNDVNMAALGEMHRGSARQTGDFVLIKVGSGVGAGFVTGGRLYRGHLGGAGDIAHIPVPVTSPQPCRCGKSGCLVTVASGIALGREANALAVEGGSAELRRLAERAGRPLTAADLATAALAGDPASVRVLDRAGELLGWAVSVLVNVFNPELVLLTGGVMGARDVILPAVRRSIYAQSTPLATRELRIERAAAGGPHSVVGAALATIDDLLGPDRLDDWPIRPGS